MERNETEAHRICRGESLWGYCKSSDNWAIRRNLQLLTMAGVDFIVFDYTNGEVGAAEMNTATQNIIDAIKTLRSKGWNPPRIAFYTNTNSGSNALAIYRRLYESKSATDGEMPIRTVHPTTLLERKSTMMNRILGTMAIAACGALAAPAKVFILSGQSNMGGSGSMSDLPGLGYKVPSNVMIFRDQDRCPEASFGCLSDDHSWRRLRVNPADWSFGPEMGIGEILSTRYPNETVYLLKVSYGGTFLHSIPPSETWEFPENAQGWTSGGTSTPLTWNLDGTVGANVTGNDPMIVSPDMSSWNVPISTTVNNIIRVKFRNASPSSIGAVYFLPKGGQWSEANSKRFKVQPNDATSREYVIDMSTVPGWKENLFQLRIDPSMGTSGSFSFDYVRLASGAENRVWDFTSPAGSSGWFPNGAIANFHLLGNVGNRPSDGALFGSVTTLDPYVTSPGNLLTVIDSAKTLRIRLWNGTGDNQAQVYFTTTTSTGFDEAKCVVFPIVPWDNGYRDYYVDMSVKDSWRGKLLQLRIDPVLSATSGNFAIDQVALLGWAQPAWLNLGSDLYAWYKRNVKKALDDLTSQGIAYSVEGFFWMQGESDASNAITAPAYQQSLSTFVSRVRNDLGKSNLPFVYGMIHSAKLSQQQYLGMRRAYGATGSDAEILAGYTPLMWTYSKQVQAAQYQAQWSIPNVRCVEGPGREETQVAACDGTNPGICDPAHYGSSGILSVGRNFGNAWLDHLNNPSSKGCGDPSQWN